MGTELMNGIERKNFKDSMYKNICALEALLVLDKILKLERSDEINSAYENTKSKKDNTVNTEQMKSILNILSIPYEQKNSNKDLSKISLIYLKYKDDPKGIKHWVTKVDNIVYDSLSEPSENDEVNFYQDNPAYEFSRAFNLKL